MLGARGQLSVVVGLARQDLMAPVELLHQDYTRQLMRKGERTKREAMIDILEVQAERATDHEAEVLAAVPAPLQKRTEGDRIHRLAVTMQQ